MGINLNAHFLICLLTMLGILLCNNIWSQTNDSVSTINLPLPHEDLSLYDFAEVRMETDKTEKPPPDITKRNFRSVKEIFEKDEFHLPDSVKSLWIKFQIANNQSNDTTIALVFTGAVSKAVLYKAVSQAHTRMAISASFSFIAPKFEIDVLNCSLVIAY